MLGRTRSRARGGGNPLLSAAEVLSKNGYFKQTETQWGEKFNKKFGLDGKREGRKSLRDYWTKTYLQRNRD